LDEARRKYLEKTTDYTSPDSLRKNTKNFLEKYHLTARIVNAERGLKTSADVFLRAVTISKMLKREQFVHRDFYGVQGLKIRGGRCREGL